MKPKRLVTAQRNLAKEEEDGLANLAELITTNGLVIKPADKGSGVVLMHDLLLYAGLGYYRQVIGQSFLRLSSQMLSTTSRVSLL